MEELELDEVEDLELEDEPEELEPEPAPKRGRSKTAVKAPAKKAPARKAARKAPVEDDDESEEDTGFDSNWLADYVNEVTGSDYDSRAIRMVLRKLAREEIIEREIGTDRSRYTFSGPGDPRVKAVLRSVRSGAVEEAKSEAIDKAKAGRTAKKTAGTKVAAATKKAAPAKATRRTRRAPVEDEDDE